MKKTILATALALGFGAAAGGIGYTVTNNYNQANIKDLNTQIEQKETANADQRQEISGLNKSINSLTVEKDNLIAENNNKSESIKNLQSDIENKQTQIENLQKDMTAKSNKIETLNSQISSNNTQISNLQADIDEKKAEIARLEAEGEDNTATINSLNADIQNKQTQISNLTADVATKTSELNDLQTRFDELEEKYGSCYDELDQSKARVTELENEIATNNTTINDLNTQLTQKQSELAALQLSINEKDETINKYKDTLSGISNKYRKKEIISLNKVGDSTLDANYYWSDGDNVYYNDSYKFNKETLTWEAFSWNFSIPFSSSDIFKIGSDVYLHCFSGTYILNKNTSTWDPVTFNSNFSWESKNVWNNGDDTYYSNDSEQYKLNKKTLTWEAFSWNGFTNIIGENIWLFGSEYHYSGYNNGWKQYKLNEATSTWEEYSFGGFNNFEGKTIIDLKNFGYLCRDSDSNYYHLSAGEWLRMDFPYLGKLGHIWSDGEKFYISSIGQNFIINFSDTNDIELSKITILSPFVISGVYQYYSMNNQYYCNIDFSTFVYDENKNYWAFVCQIPLSTIGGSAGVWSDGTDYYFSDIDTYKFNFETKSWEIFDSNNRIYGGLVWSDNQNIYHSNINGHKVFNLQTKTWDTITFTGVTTFYGHDVFKVNNHCYYVDSSKLYILNTSSRNWEIVDFSKSDFSSLGSSISSVRYDSIFWSDGINNYYSTSDYSKIFDFSTNTWIEIELSRPPEFNSLSKIVVFDNGRCFIGNYEII